MKKFFTLMIISCMLLCGGCSNTTVKTTSALPECNICHQSNTSHDWKLVSVSVHAGDTLYWYECRYCRNVISVKKPIIRECFQK